MNFYSIADIENAINYWRDRQASGDNFAVCSRARVLADVYGSMIFFGSDRVEAKSLTPDQNEALSLALAQRELSI